MELSRVQGGLPPAELPPARGDVEPTEGDERPEVGVLELKVPEFSNETFAYVPESYDPAVPHGVVAWLHAPGKYSQEELLALWKPLCDSYDLILLAPKADDLAKWKPTEATLVRKLLDELTSNYTVDPARVVLHGYQAGGTMARA